MISIPSNLYMVFSEASLMSKEGTRQEMFCSMEPAAVPGGHSTITLWFRHGQQMQLSHRRGLTVLVSEWIHYHIADQVRSR